MPRLSIIIPALGGVEQLEATLVSVLAHRPPQCEVIVPLGIAYDDPYDLRGEVAFVEPRGKAGLVRCVLAGIEHSTGSIIHVVASGGEVAEGWADAALVHFADPQIAAVAPRLSIGEEPCMASCGVAYAAGGARRTVAADDAELAPSHVLGPELSAAFYRRSALTAVGGLPENLGDELADVDLALRLHHAGFAAVFEPGCRVHLPPARQTSAGVLRQAVYEERLFLRNLPIAGWGRGLLGHVPVVAARCVRSRSAVRQILGRTLAWGQLGRMLSHHRRLRSLEALPAIVEFDPASSAKRRALNCERQADPMRRAG